MYRVFTSSLFAALLFMLVNPCAAEEFDRIKAEGEMSFSMSGQYPPFNFVNENNVLSGFDVDVCKEIARRIGVAPKPMSIAWDGIVAGLLANKYSLICGSMAITEARLNTIDFSDAYYRSGAQLFVPAISDITSARQLENMKIGVTLGTTYEEWVRANLASVDVRTYKGVPEMVLEIAYGRLDGFITDRIVGAMAIDEKGAPIKMAGPLLYEEQMGIAFNKGNPKLSNAINEALAAMKEDGTYHDISVRWLKVDAR
ncbi:MAG: ABC transporter substrate-binding protein [Georgfuchsia sp.]